MRRLAKSEEHRQRISDSLRGKPKICSLCGEEGHNKRGCPNAEAIQVWPAVIQLSFILHSRKHPFRNVGL